MKNNLITLTVVILLSGTISKAGQDRGGGDPNAAEFADVLIKVADFLKNNESVVPEADRSKIKPIVSELVSSINHPTKSKIEIVELRPKDQFGIEKAALFSMNPLYIKIHQHSWASATGKEQVMLASMELLGLVGVSEQRYFKAKYEIAEHYQEILIQKSADESYYIVDEETKRISNLIVDAIKNTKFLNCINNYPEQADFADLRSNDGSFTIRFRKADDDYANWYGNIMPANLHDPIELNTTGTGFFGLNEIQDYAGQLFKQTVLISFSNDQKEIKNVTYAFFKLIKINAGTILDPISQTKWQQLNSAVSCYK